MPQKRILVVEDDDAIRFSLSEILKMEGYRVLEAENGKEALDKMTSESELPELIILDLMMPVMNGHEFLAEKNNREKWNQIPVLVVSAVADRHSSPVQGVVGYMQKPVEVSDLLDFIEAQLK